MFCTEHCKYPVILLAYIFRTFRCTLFNIKKIIFCNVHFGWNVVPKAASHNKNPVVFKFLHVEKEKWKSWKIFAANSQVQQMYWSCINGCWCIAKYLSVQGLGCYHKLQVTSSTILPQHWWKCWLLNFMIIFQTLSLMLHKWVTLFSKLPLKYFTSSAVQGYSLPDWDFPASPFESIPFHITWPHPTSHQTSL